MRISELIRELEEIKERDGDLEIWADAVPLDDAVEELELAEFSIHSRVNLEDEILIMDVYPQGEQRELL